MKSEHCYQMWVNVVWACYHHTRRGWLASRPATPITRTPTVRTPTTRRSCRGRRRAPMDVDTVVDKKPPQKPRPKKLSRQERLDRDELERDALPEDDERGRSVLRAELALKREVEGRWRGSRVRTADERRLERCLDILAWCAAARRITAVACAAQAREERAEARTAYDLGVLKCCGAFTFQYDSCPSHDDGWFIFGF